MKTHLLALLSLFCIGTASAQTPRDERIARAVERMDDGDYDEAARLLESVLAADPKNFLANYETGYLLYMQERYEEAVEVLRRIKRKDYPPLYQLLGNAYDMAGDRKRAVKTYEKGLRENPDAGRLYLELGNIAYAERQYDRALACYRRGATVDPAHPSNYRSLALLYAISTEPVWTLVWGELFMNLERGSGRTSAMSETLARTYRDNIRIEGDTAVRMTFSRNGRVAREGLRLRQYVVIPRGQQLRSLTPTGANGLAFTARYGTVGLAVEQQEFIAEGINEAGLSAGLFFFPQYGGYESYDPDRNDRTLADLQVAAWMLTQFATIDEVKAAVASVRIVALEKSSVVHWRIGEASGRQVVLEIVDGVPHFYENEVGVLTNAPGFEWQLTNLDNYVNLYPGDAPVRQLSGITLRPTGSNSGFLGIPGDATPPSRFVRAAFYRATAPQRATAFGTVLQCFHLLNCFDIPIGIDHPQGDAPDIPSATQLTSAIDLTHRRVYYKTAYDNSIRCIDLAEIDFGRVKYQSHPLDEVRKQPVVKISVTH